MKKLAMCRVCLGEGIRLVPIVGTHLQEIYESLVLLPFETEDGRPILVCCICHTRLKNSYDLRNSCLESEKLLTQMLNRNEPEQMKQNFKNITHLIMGPILSVDADIVGVQALKCDMKVKPNDGEVIGENVLEDNSVSDVILPADSDIKNEVSMGHVLEVDADSVGVETLFVSCDVKNEQSDPGDVDEDVLEESSVSGDVPFADSHDDFVITVKEEHIGHKISDSTAKEPTQDVLRSSEYSTSSNLNEHKLVQDTFKKLHEVTAAGITDENKKRLSVQYTCDTCRQCYSSKCELERHVRLCFDVWEKDLSRGIPKSAQTRTSQKQHQCTVCDKLFARKFILKIHMRIHTGEKPHQCHVCKKQFSQKSNLTSHMRTHTAEKPFHCNKCKKQFSHKDHLIGHMRTHTGDKPYHCDICKKQFSLRHNLTRHMNTHTFGKAISV